MKKIRRTAALVYAIALASTTVFAACTNENISDETEITLSDSKITVNGKNISSDENDSVYASNDIVYYEDKDFYESGNPYGEGTDADKHTEEEANAHTVINITESGTYRISGTLSQGQIAVDLGDNAKGDPNAVVTLILDNAGITCSVAPAVIFYNVYECDEAWYSYDEGETESYEASSLQDTTDAGANIIIADGSINNINGSYVARIYKDNEEQKKKHKYDAAFYSKMSMNVDGEEIGDGILNINAENEGLDSELHLTINGGKINILSGNDGINTNEDGVSVTTINDGALHIVAGIGEEGDGIDSNGYLVINGGTIISAAKPMSDSGLDADLGSYINGGYVVATGSTMDWAESDSNQVTMNLQFASSKANDEAIIITDLEDNVIFAYDPDKDETTGSYNRGYQGAVISSPEFKVGETYNVYIGGDVTGEETDGLYDISTVTAFSSAVKQEYTGNDVGRFPGGFGGRMKPEGLMPFGVEGITDNGDGTITVSKEAAQEMAKMISSRGEKTVTAEEIEKCTTIEELMAYIFDGRDHMRPDDMNGKPAMPPQNEGEIPPDFPNDKMKPEGNRPDFSNNPPAEEKGPETASDKFYMNDKVNAFSGVTDKNIN